MTDWPDETLHRLGLADQSRALVYTSLTATGSVVGTPTYMALEVFLGQAVEAGEHHALENATEGAGSRTVFAGWIAACSPLGTPPLAAEPCASSGLTPRWPSASLHKRTPPGRRGSFLREYLLGDNLTRMSMFTPSRVCATIAFCFLLGHPASAKADLEAVVAFLSASPEIGLIVKGASLTGSIVGIFSESRGKEEHQKILKELEYLKEQNQAIMTGINTIVAKLDALPGVVQDIVNRELRVRSRQDKVDELSGLLQVFYELRRSEVANPKSVNEDTWHRHETSLGDLRAVSRQLMLPDYGFSCFQIVGRTMAVEFWASKRLGAAAELRKEAADTYFTYFERALSAKVEKSIQQSIRAVLKAQREIKSALDENEEQLKNSNVWIVKEGQVISKESCDVTVADLQHRITGDQHRGFSLVETYVNHRTKRVCGLRDGDGGRGVDLRSTENEQEIENTTTIQQYWEGVEQSVNFVAMSDEITPQEQFERLSSALSKLSWTETERPTNTQPPSDRVKRLEYFRQARTSFSQWEQFLNAAKSELQLFRDAASLELSRAKAQIEASRLAVLRAENEAAEVKKKQLPR